MSSTETALAALAEGEIEFARNALVAIVAKFPADARAWKGLAEAHRRLDEWPEAIAALDHVATNTRGSSEAVQAWIVKAELYDRQLDDPRQAQKAWEKVLQLDDTTALAWLALAELSLRRSKWQAAVANADHGLQFGRLDAKVQSWLLLCRAVGQKRASQSVGPTSTFFNRLGKVEDGTQAVIQALRAWPRLREFVGPTPLQDTDATVRLIQAHRPLARPPSWWGR